MKYKAIIAHIIPKIILPFIHSLYNTIPMIVINIIDTHVNIEDIEPSSWRDNTFIKHVYDIISIIIIYAIHLFLLVLL